MIGSMRGRWAAALAALAAVAVLAACGGGGGVGSGGTGIASVSAGTVTGFGSVVVDGVRFDDRDARVEVQDRPGESALAEARLGQRVEVESEVDGVAQVVRVEAEVRGLVSQLVPGGLKVLQQTVLVNTDAALGPVTQFADGYTALADVAVGHVVEVHGVPRLQGGGYIIQATRIERKAALTAFVRVAGLVANLGASSFKIGGLTVDFGTAVIVPAGRSLANGQRVVVLARPPAGGAAAATVVAEQVRIKERVNGPIETTLAGVVSTLNRATGKFDLGGLTVDYGAARVDPLPALLADGRYVRVRGRFADDGSFVATRVQIRKLDGEPESELKGTVVDFDAVAQRFTVRGVVVSFAGATISDCPTGLANGVFVEVEGDLGSAGVVATKLKCEDAPAGAVVEREGGASAVNVSDKTFTLTPSSGGPITVRWTVLTYFREGLTPATLQGQQVEVEGIFIGNVLVARKIKPRN